MPAPLKIFIIYAREDESFKTSLLKAFKPLHRSGKIEIFHDGLIKPGERWEDAILKNLHTAHIILPLVSTDFFDSEFIHEVEFKKAVDRYNKGETNIIPIILKHCGWRYDPIISTLQVLPKDGKPVVTWAYHEEAWEQILDTVHEVTEKTKEKNRLEAEQFFNLGLKATDFQEQIKYYSKAIELHPDYADAYINRGAAKYDLDQYVEAIKDFDEAIRLKPDYAIAFSNRGNVKRKLSQYIEAIKDYDQALKLKSDYANAFNGRGTAKEDLGLFEDAKKDYQKALNIDPANEIFKNNLRNLEEKLKQNP